MFQYACGRSLACAKQTSLYLDTSYYELQARGKLGGTRRTYDLDLFGIRPEPIPFWLRRRYERDFCSRVMRRLKLLSPLEVIDERGVPTFQPEIFESGTDAVLQGYWQSEKYFLPIADEIRTTFQDETGLDPQIRDLCRELENENSVCVFIRRGDYLHLSEHTVQDRSYFDRAREILDARFSGLKFYLFDDESGWGAKTFQDWSNTHLVESENWGERYFGKFHLMRACRHFIIANSSFSWWAAWLGEAVDKTVIAPDRWFNDDQFHAQTYDLLPPDWIRLG